MPWCEPCEQWHSPNALTEDGHCPGCGGEVTGSDDLGDPADVKIPWHFWLLLGATTVYLVWRLLEALGWLAGQV